MLPYVYTGTWWMVVATPHKRKGKKRSKILKMIPSQRHATPRKRKGKKRPKI
jgi:hypothetical protein